MTTTALRSAPCTRRAFLRTGALAAGALAGFPSILPASVLGPNGPNSRIHIACIGVGGQGTGNMRNFLGRADARVVAVCDVDRARLEKAKKTVDDTYSDTACHATADFREILARPDIDAVMIGTPENWHSLLTIAAAKAGKDIYCEKPFAPTIAEGRAAADAVRKYGRILQVGSHERSRPGARLACELVRSGRIGRLRTVRVNLPAARNVIGPQPEEPIPEGFDYDLWLGPAPWAPYTRRRCHGTFRWILDYSDGELTDRGCHVGDLAHWGMGADATGPLEIEGRGTFPDDGLFNTAYDYEIHARYARGVRLVIAGVEPRGVRFEGDEGWIFCHVHGGHLEASSESIIRTPPGPGDVRLYDDTNDHHRNFLDCIRTRRQTVAHAEAGHRTSSLCHLANISLLTGRKLRWDPAAERFQGDDRANALVGRAMRPPWSLV